jgi:hypothetical protein
MIIEIPEVFAEGNVRAAFIPAISNLATGPTLTEVNAGVLLGKYLMPDWDGFNGTQNKGESRRFSSRETYQRFGRTAHSIAPLVYTYNPQLLGTPGSPGNEVYEACAEGNLGYFVMGYGLLAEDELTGEPLPFEANDIISFAPAECGEQFEAARGADEFAPLTVTQELIVKGKKIKNRKIAA